MLGVILVAKILYTVIIRFTLEAKFKNGVYNCALNEACANSRTLKGGQR